MSQNKQLYLVSLQCDTGGLTGSFSEFPGYIVRADNRESATPDIHPDIEETESAKVSESSSPPKHDSPSPILSLNEVSSSKQDQPSRSTPDLSNSPSPSPRPNSPSPRYSPPDPDQSTHQTQPLLLTDQDSQYLRQSYLLPEHIPTMKNYHSEPSSSSPSFVPKYPWHHPPHAATPGSAMANVLPNPSLVPLLLPYPSLSHSVIYMSQYMNPFMPTCSGSTLAEKKKRNRTFIDPVSEVRYRYYQGYKTPKLGT